MLSIVATYIHMSFISCYYICYCFLHIIVATYTLLPLLLATDRVSRCWIDISLIRCHIAIIDSHCRCWSADCCRGWSSLRWVLPFRYYIRCHYAFHYAGSATWLLYIAFSAAITSYTLPLPAMPSANIEGYYWQLFTLFVADMLPYRLRCHWVTLRYWLGFTLIWYAIRCCCYAGATLPRHLFAMLIRLPLFFAFICCSYWILSLAKAQDTRSAAIAADIDSETERCRFLPEVFCSRLAASCRSARHWPVIITLPLIHRHCQLRRCRHCPCPPSRCYYYRLLAMMPLILPATIIIAAMLSLPHCHYCRLLRHFSPLMAFSLLPISCFSLQPLSHYCHEAAATRHDFLFIITDTYMTLLLLADYFSHTYKVADTYIFFRAIYCLLISLLSFHYYCSLLLLATFAMPAIDEDTRCFFCCWLCLMLAA